MNKNYNIDEIHSVANNIFGISKLKNQQISIIENFINGKDIFAILATGFGKSICYQLPAILTNKVVIVISPLIALMEDQAKSLKEKNINVICLNSLNKNKNKDLDNLLINSDTNIIYTSPEYIVNNPDIITDLYNSNRLLGFAIDETHCVHQWSDESFRPVYKGIAKLRDSLNIPIMAVTASCTEKVKNEIIKMLNLKNPYITKSSFYRENLKIGVYEKSKDTWQDIKQYITKDKVTIVYVRTIKETEDICILIRSKGFFCTYFNGSLSNGDKKIVLDKFLSGKVNIIVATIAFGLGINKNVDTIIQYGMSNDLDSYYQEIGRGGRYGNECNCVCFYSKKEIHLHKYFITQIENTNLQRHKFNELNKIIKYVTQESECRWKLILGHFNEKFNECNKCDVCLIKAMKKKETKKEEEDLDNIIVDEVMSIYLMVFNEKMPLGIVAKMKNIDLYELGLYLKKAMERNLVIDKKILGITDIMLINIKQEYNTAIKIDNNMSIIYNTIQHKYPKYNVIQIIVSIELIKKYK